MANNNDLKILVALVQSNGTEILETLNPRQGIQNYDLRKLKYTIKLTDWLPKETFEEKQQEKLFLKCRYKEDTKVFDTAGLFFNKNPVSYYLIGGRWALNERNDLFFATTDSFISLINSCQISLKQRFPELRKKELPIGKIHTFAAINIIGRAAPIIYYYKQFQPLGTMNTQDSKANEEPFHYQPLAKTISDFVEQSRKEE
ncbi:MAG: hypothetical protein K2X39_04345 [Silvanigrellaceae bacterium]|nr:hypothetical protein [Silvanigrellaceae bacterium]